MAMTAGTATITANANGSASYGGSGMALALAQARFPSYVTQWTTAAGEYAGSVLPSNLLSTYQGIASFVAAQCEADATAIVSYIQANAVAVVTTQVLGSTPNPNNPSTPIVAPGSGSPVDIPIT